MVWLQLLISKKRDKAKTICMVQLEKSKKCSTDPLYNMAVANWDNRPIAKSYLTMAVKCNPGFTKAINLLKQFK